MGKFVIRRGKAGFLFCLKAANGEIIAVSSAYASEAACRKGIESVAHSAAEAAVEDQTAGKQAACPKFEAYLDRQGEFRFRLRARNGQIIAVSEGYAAKKNCLGGIESVRRNAPRADVFGEPQE